MGKFTCTKIRVLCVIGSKRYYKGNFRGVHIFADIQETRITRKYVQHENIYVHSRGPSALTTEYRVSETGLPTHFISDGQNNAVLSCISPPP